MLAEVMQGALYRFTHPARFSFAHGGKDGHPFPVPLKVYDDSMAVLRRSLDAAKIGRSDKLQGMSRLDDFTRSIERRIDPRADVAATISHERAISPSLGGRTVMDDRRPARLGPKTAAQLELFDSPVAGRDTTRP